MHGRDGEGKSQCFQIVELSLVQLIVHLTADQRIIYVLYEVNFVQQEGVIGCRRVRVDFERLEALKAGDRLALLPGHGVSIILLAITER